VAQKKENLVVPLSGRKKDRSASETTMQSQKKKKKGKENRKTRRGKKASDLSRIKGKGCNTLPHYADNKTKGKKRENDVGGKEGGD